MADTANPACRACGSTRVLRDQHLITQTYTRAPVLVTGFSESGVGVRVCVDCGHIELMATDLERLRATYAEHKPLDLNS